MFIFFYKGGSKPRRYFWNEKFGAFFRKVKTWHGGGVFFFFLNFPQEERELIIHLQRNFREEKLTVAEWGIDWGRETSRVPLDLCLCWLKLTDNCSWIFFSNLLPPPPSFFFFFFFFPFWCQDHAFSLALNHLDFHLDVAVISLKYSEWPLFFLIYWWRKFHSYSIPGPFILLPPPPSRGMVLSGARK